MMARHGLAPVSERAAAKTDSRSAAAPGEPEAIVSLDTAERHILHCLRAPVGGLFRHVLDLAGEQAAQGHAVGIVADSSTSNALTANQLAALAPHLKLGVTLVAMRRQPGIGDVASAIAVFRTARRMSATILHGHGAKGGTYARLATLLLRASGRTAYCYYTPHGGSLHYATRAASGRLVAMTERGLSRLTDGLIFESAFAREAYLGNIGKPSCRMRVIPNGLRPKDFAPHVARLDAADFVFVGELRTLKGVDVLLKALAEIRAERDVSAVIVGDGPDAAALYALATALNLQDVVHFPGALPAAEAFQLGRCLIVPSRAESLPYVVLEAAAAGIPLIATDVGGIPEIVAGTRMQLIPPDDVATLALAMRQKLDDPGRALRDAMELRVAVRRGFNVRAMAEAVLDVYGGF